MAYIARTRLKYTVGDASSSVQKFIEPGRRVPAALVDDLVTDDLIAIGAIEHVEDEGGDREHGVEKPLRRMSRAELDAIVKAEGVDIGDASTNAQIVTAIETAREERAQG